MSQVPSVPLSVPSGLACSLALAVACTPASERSIERTRAFILQHDATSVFQNAMRTAVEISGPDGTKFKATAESLRGATTAGFAESLSSSLRAHGCDVSPHEAVDISDRLAGAMQRRLVLPEGYVLHLPVVVEEIDRSVDPPRWFVTDAVTVRPDALR